jgi:hypothetical protein
VHDVHPIELLKTLEFSGQDKIVEGTHLSF